MYLWGLQAENEMNWNHNRPTNMKQQAADTFFFPSWKREKVTWGSHNTDGEPVWARAKNKKKHSLTTSRFSHRAGPASCVTIWLRWGHISKGRRADRKRPSEWIQNKHASPEINKRQEAGQSRGLCSRRHGHLHLLTEPFTCLMRSYKQMIVLCYRCWLSVFALSPAEMLIKWSRRASR